MMTEFFFEKKNLFAALHRQLKNTLNQVGLMLLELLVNRQVLLYSTRFMLTEHSNHYIHLGLFTTSLVLSKVLHQCMHGYMDVLESSLG